jgi:hypothetical protein
MSNVREFRRDAYLTIAPGKIVAEFACGTMALDFIERCLDRSFTVTAGNNLTFAVRKRQPESAVVNHSADAPPASSLPREAGAGFTLTGFTDKGKAALPELLRVLARLPHTGDM